MTAYSTVFYQRVLKEITDALLAGVCRSGRVVFEPSRNKNESYYVQLRAKHSDKLMDIQRWNLGDFLSSVGMTSSELGQAIKDGTVEVTEVGYRLYDTHVVAARPDGAVCINWWDSKTTQRFVADYAPMWLRAASGRAGSNYMGAADSPLAVPTWARPLVRGEWLARVQWQGRVTDMEASGVWLYPDGGRGAIIAGDHDEAAVLSRMRVSSVHKRLTPEGREQARRHYKLLHPLLLEVRQAVMGARAAGMAPHDAQLLAVNYAKEEWAALLAAGVDRHVAEAVITRTCHIAVAGNAGTPTRALVGDMVRDKMDGMAENVRRTCDFDGNVTEEII